MKNRLNRYHSSHEVDTEGSWAISYGDMITLLLTFFILFFTADKFQMQKQLRLDIKAKQDDVLNKLTASIEESLETLSSKKAQVQGKVFRSGQKLYVEFSGVSFFPSGKVTLREEAKQALNEFYNAFSPHMGNHILSIRAFTDPRKVKQTEKRAFKDNLELSALRSIEVMRYMQKSGIPLGNMKLSGYGEMELRPEAISQIPVEERTPSSIHALSRTTVLIIEAKEKAL
jgi:chemotaxis protein MotB